MKLVVYIVGLVVLLSFVLYLQIRLKSSTIERFDQNIPTPLPTPIRSDNTCSDPNSSSKYDRVSNGRMGLLQQDVSIPPSRRNNTLAGSISGGTLDLSELASKCKGGTSGDEKGTKVFVDTGKPSLQVNTGLPWRDIDSSTYNEVDVFCCKGQVYTVPGTTEKICLAACPSNYTVSTSDETECVREDNKCIYTADLSANISDSWLRTCAMIYKNSTNLTSTIGSISSVVSTFTFQTNFLSNDYRILSNDLYRPGASYSPALLNNRNNNFSNITNRYDAVQNLQNIINSRYNTLKADKIRFDTLYNQFGCSNYRYS